MYLKSLEMVGFKSFAEARIEFPDGVTAIVGPNGSGKSNVVDAILWVLGEQSTKTLRSEKMEDVIFNGTELRKPLGMAEVSLVISGLDKIAVDPLSGLPSQLAEFQDLMITRRLYRNGDSEYLINKTLCRLKDVRSILLDTRAGTKGHTVIAQGQIDQILNASPQDRRELIEETAGIVRYKKQKAEALRKLDATQQNLLRVRDIIAEVKKQLNSLERQARQARSYQVLQQEAKQLEIRLLTSEYRQLREAMTGIERELDALGAQESEQAAKQSTLHADLEQVRLELAAGSDIIGRHRDELAKVEHQQSQALTAAEVERHRSEMYEQQRVQGGEELRRLAQEQDQVAAAERSLQDTLERLARELREREAVLAGLDRDVSALMHQRAAALQEEERGRRDVLNLAVLVANTEQSLSQLALRVEELAARDGRLIREREECQAQHDATIGKRQELQQARADVTSAVSEGRKRQLELERESEETSAALTDLDQRLLRQSEDLAATDSHLRTLQSLLQEEMGYGRSGEEEATALKACAGVQEAVAEWLTVPAGLDRAVEAWLGERVRGWLVESPTSASEAVAFLKGKDLGRGTFIPQSLRWTTPGDPAWWPALAGQAGIVGRAVDLIAVEGHGVSARDYLFDAVVFVETLEDAVRLWHRAIELTLGSPTFVTKTGDILEAAGVITGGQTGSAGGLLQRRREVSELKARCTSLATAVEEGRLQREQLLEKGQSLRDESRRVADALRDAEMRQLSLQKDDAGLQLFLGDLLQRLDTLTGDARQGSAEVQRLQQEARSTEAQLAQWISERAGQERVLGDVRQRVSQFDQGLQELQQRVTEAQLQVQEVRTTSQHHRQDLERVKQEREETAARVATLTQQVEMLRSSWEQSCAERTRQEEICRELGRAVDDIKGKLVAAQERHAQGLTQAQAIEESLEEVRRTLSTLRDSRMAIEVKRAEVRTQLGTVESTLSGTYQVDPATIPDQDASAEAGVPVAEGQEGVSDGELRQQLQKIRERLDRMGPINLAAINEHQELEERHRFLSTQEQDLSASIASLKEIIQRINRTTKDMFATTFAELQEQFGQVFTKFFPGGRAELQLVEVPVEESSESKGPQEPGVEIVAQPPGKRLKNISMLSGGEKTLTAMALLFASFLIRPTPFCILDEIDAPLDEENIGRFTAVLRELAQDAQFMVITHNKRTMSIADSLFGVTMEEPGISKLVSVRLNDLQPA